MKIIIAGYGFVGQAVASSLRETVLVLVDPKYTNNKISDYQDADGVIISVGTPRNQIGDCDVSQIYDVMKDVPERMPVLIKSTVSPDLLEKIVSDFPTHNICYSPEFLRAVTANDDFANQTYMIIGGKEPSTVWEQLFRSSLKKLETVAYCSITEAAMVKYTINCFLSLKVAYFNQIYDICQTNGADFRSVVNLALMDSRIGASHTQVPGPDGSRGFGGACFPKDTEAFIYYSDRMQQVHTLVESAVKYNKKIRKKP